jgi:DNA-binding GntR family transcriptional regulator
MPRDDLGAVLALPENRSLAVDVAERLRAAILGGHFGPGERLREEELARSMGVSRGPIREALFRLEREGLLVIRRNRGAVVAQLSREDLDEVYTLRVAIERLAVQRAVALGGDAAMARIQSVVDEIAVAVARGISEQEAAELDLKFHDRIYLAANHRRLYDTWTTLKPQLHILFLNRNVASSDFRIFAVTSHQEILDAIRDRDEALAVQLTETHLRSSYELAVRLTETHLRGPHDRVVTNDGSPDRLLGLNGEGAREAGGLDGAG